MSPVRRNVRVQASYRGLQPRYWAKRIPQQFLLRTYNLCGHRERLVMVFNSSRSRGGGSHDAHKDSHHEVHAKSRVDDRGPSVSLAGSSSSHLPWGGASSTSSLPPSPPPAAIKKTSGSMRQTKDTPPGEPERRLGSSDNCGEVTWIMPCA
ncbi:hypothetical protein BGW80DRAFT_127119 [Lactifluus volemus]|nr:hypothetical protein BGW80DRAFT_127119 [Lactifluus volemus]